MPNRARNNPADKRARKLFASLVWIVFVLSSALSAKAERLPIKRLTISDGLPQNSINKIAQDAIGFFWFCTNGGLARYDGYGFMNLTTGEGLPSDRILDFLVTREGDYWLATDAGLVKFDPEGAIYDRPVSAEEAALIAERPVFTTYPVPNEKIKIVTKILQDSQGTVWVGTGKGLFRLVKNARGFDELVSFDLGTLETPGASYIYALYEDRRGAVWVGTENKLHRISTGGRVTGFTPDEPKPIYFRAFLEDSEGNFWVGTALKGLFRFTVDENEVPQLAQNPTTRKNSGEQKETLLVEWIDAIAESFDGKLWLAGQSGLFEFDPATGKLSRYTRQSGLQDHRYQTIFRDKSGNLWLGTRSNGAVRLSRHGLVTFDSEEGVTLVRSLFADTDGRLLIAGFLASGEINSKSKVELNTASSLFTPFKWHLGRFEENALKWLIPKLPKEFEYLGSGENQWSFRAKTGEWWIATGRGLLRYPKVPFDLLDRTDPDKIFNAASGLNPQNVFRLYEDSRGDIWISTSGDESNGFYRWEKETETLLDLTEDSDFSPGAMNLISAFAEDAAGNLWLGFSVRGIARRKDGRTQFFNEANGLPPGGVNSIFRDSRGRIWLASALGGVVRIDAPEDDRLSFARITKADGLSSDRTFALTEDRQGLIYIATDRDINRLNPATGEIKILKVSGEQAQREYRSAFCDANGVLWFGTTAGLVKYVPLQETGSRAPEVLLTQIEIEGRSQRIPLTGATELNLPPLASDENQVRIDFISLATLDEEDLRYQYRFDSESEWSTPSTERSLNFAGLAAGDYKIFIRAVGGATSEKPAIIAFKIPPPIYQRWWFLTLALLAVAAVAYAFYRYRINKLLEIQQIQTRIATDLHDDIGANLTRISLLSEVARQKSDNGNGNLLSSIADIARESVASMNDIVWAISPDHDSLVDLTRRMRQHAEEIFALRDIDLKFNAPRAETALKLSVAVRHDVLLIFKEAVNNAARHSGCTKVSIDFRADDALFLQIKDNGKGFDVDSERDGQGLRSMKRRANSLGGDLIVRSTMGNGTSVEFVLALAKKAALKAKIKK